MGTQEVRARPDIKADVALLWLLQVVRMVYVVCGLTCVLTVAMHSPYACLRCVCLDGTQDRGHPDMAETEAGESASATHQLSVQPGPGARKKTRVWNLCGQDRSTPVSPGERTARLRPERDRLHSCGRRDRL
jgi:hypothetical protein